MEASKKKLKVMDNDSFEEMTKDQDLMESLNQGLDTKLFSSIFLKCFPSHLAIGECFEKNGPASKLCNPYFTKARVCHSSLARPDLLDEYLNCARSKSEDECIGC